MTARFATEEEIKDWNKHIITNPDGGNIFASYEFAMQKVENGGYNARFIMTDNLAMTVLEENVPFLGKFWYLPKGPGVASTKALLAALKSIEPFAKKNGVFAVRIESELLRNQQPTLARHGLFKSRPVIPNPSTITLDISDSLETVIANLPQKGRHAIRRAERDGVTAELVEATDENCKIMYNLFAETAKGKFEIRSYDYYRTFWQRFETAGYGQLFFAYYDKQIVAGAYAMAYGTKSTYKDGASIQKRNVYGASHLLQWRVIEWAKSRGVKLHDFCGSPPSEEINNPNHEHHGIGLFKTAFNKTVTDYIGCYDFAIHPIRYKIWINFGEKVSHSWHYHTHDGYY
jgi:lipid II:glycine glycyltransferase (peptidoglycan interpeptide bridge formation enzyme)